MIKDDKIGKMLKVRYAGWDKGIGRKIEKGRIDFGQLEKYALKNGEPKVQSGRQELLENLLNEYI